jgi:hypothetical protein
MRPGVRRAGWSVLVACAVMITGAAVWFILVQLIEIKALCPYCMVEHTIGLVLAMLILAGAEAGRAIGRAMTVGVIAVALLIGGQWLYTPRQMQQFQIGSIEVDLNLVAWPVLGERRAEHVIISMFDYACPHCRAMHEYLTAARHRYGDRFAIVLMPLPQNQACNDAVEYTEENFKESCELAEIALAVFIADPGALDGFDAWMFASEQRRTAAEARAEARRLVGADALDAALKSGRPRQMIAASVVIHKQTLAIPADKIEGANAPGSIHPFDRVPKLIVGETIFVSRPGSAQELFEAFEATLGIEPVEEGR